MPFIHNINPTLLQLGPFEIRYYGIIYALGFLLAYYILNLYRKKGKLNITKDDLDNYIFYLVIGVVVGARLAHVVFWDPIYYLNNPLRILMLWKGGMAFHGGLAGAIIVSYYFCKKRGISFARLADILIVPTTFILALGRIANFINGELVGTVTNVSWCVKYQSIDGCRHPYQLYAALKRLIIFGILLLLNKKEHKDGFLFWIFILLTGFGRFFLDFFREDVRLLGLSVGQYFSLAMVIAGVYVLVRYYRK